MGKASMQMQIKIGGLVEPMARAREWFNEACRILDEASATEEQISTIADRWHYLKSEYTFLESDGEHKAFPKISPAAFAVISACLLVQKARELAAAEKAGKATDLDTAIGLYWICRFAWNMSKVTKVTPAAARSAASAGGKMAADVRHDAPGGARDKKRTAWELFLTGDYGTKKEHAAEKIAPIISKSFGVTRRYLQGDAPADLKAKA
jgi:hypothetical protein